MALAAAVTVTAIPVDAMAASPYSTKVARAQKKAAARTVKQQEIRKELPSYIPAAPAEDETPVVKDEPIDVTVEIPSVPADDPATEDVENQNTETFGDPVNTIEGDPPADEDDTEYDYEIVTQQGSVTVTTNKNEVKTEYGDDDLDYVHSETEPTADNDLYHTGDAAPEQFLPGYEAPAEGEENYDFVSGDEYMFEYVGSGNTSQFRPAVVFTEPMTDEEKYEKWGDYAYIGKSYSELWVSHLPDPSIAARDKDGKLILVDGFVVDKDNNRIMKEEFSVVGPDGKTYYTQRIDNPGEGIFVEGWYNDGEWHAELNAPADLENGEPVLKTVQLLNQDGTPVLDENNEPIFVEVGKMNEFANKYENGVIVHSGAYGKVIKDKDGNVMVNYLAVWAGAQQFVLVDKTTGEVITTYCADLATGTQDGFGYNIVNLEDSTYYSDDQAEMIRAIAKNGYWGTESGTGSLEAMKVMLKEAGFSDEELASLNDGVALTATQMAIWSCSNHMAGTEFVNSHYNAGNVPADKEDEVKLMFKIFEHLKALAPVSYEGEETTADTIINAQNFLDGDMEITVLEKAEDHENNRDDDDTNDAYTTTLSFALVVEPSTENGDDLVVTVVNGHGDVVAKGRVAGDDSKDKDDPTFTGITDHGKGNYSFENITMIEGDQAFNITLEGIQNLKEGVYLYTSEVLNADTPDEVSSQTMVGTAKGDHGVKVSQNIEFSFEVEDEKVVVRERHGGSKNPPTTPPDGDDPTVTIDDEEVPLAGVEEPIEIEDGDVPLADIPEEEVPLVAGEEEIVAATGDSNHMTAGFGGMFAALAGMFLCRKKKEN